MERNPHDSIEEQRRKEREYYAKNKEKILLRLKNRRNEKATISNKGDLVEHHIKYKEIHGVDETVWIPRGEHVQLHHRLRQEGKCNISPKELNRISHRAKNRTEKVKNRRKRKEFCFFTGNHTQLVDEISYDIHTDHIAYRSRFRGANGYHLKYILV